MTVQNGCKFVQLSDIKKAHIPKASRVDLSICSGANSSVAAPVILNHITTLRTLIHFSFVHLRLLQQPGKSPSQHSIITNSVDRSSARSEHSKADLTSQTLAPTFASGSSVLPKLLHLFIPRSCQKTSSLPTVAKTRLPQPPNI